MLAESSAEGLTSLEAQGAGSVCFVLTDPMPLAAELEALIDKTLRDIQELENQEPPVRSGAREAESLLPKEEKLCLQPEPADRFEDSKISEADS